MNKLEKNCSSSKFFAMSILLGSEKGKSPILPGAKKLLNKLVKPIKNKIRDNQRKKRQENIRRKGDMIDRNPPTFI